ncbi:MAG: PqqD family protein [Chthoniobacterales bacterium]
MNRQLISNFAVSPNGLGFRSDTGEVYRLNPSACEILRLISDGKDDVYISQYLSEKYAQLLPRMRNDLSSFFEHLENLRLITPHE